MQTKLDNLTLAVNHAMTEYGMAKQRAMLSRMGTSDGCGDGLDEKRARAWREFGYPANLTASHFQKAYRRNGIAFGVVDKLVSRCWTTPPTVIEGDEDEKDRTETPWEKSVADLFSATKMWAAFKEADRRRLAGRYSVLLLRVKDGKKWDEPVDTGQSPILLQAIPVWSESIKPKTYVTDVDADDYGEPATWTYIQSADDGGTKSEVEVHSSRVFVLGCWRSDSIGYLEPIYNNLVNLDKAEGGSGESLIKNSSRQLNINFDPKINLDSIAAMYGVTVQDLQEKYNEAARDVNEGTDMLMVTQGADITPLVANTPDPRPVYEVNLQTVSSGVDMPTRIIVGNQQGERASTEDNDYMNARCQSRRNIDISPEIVGFVEKLMDNGIIEITDKMSVVWDDLTESGLRAKLETAKLMVETNVAATDSLMEPVFARQQILGAAGFEDLSGKSGDVLGET